MRSPSISSKVRSEGLSQFMTLGGAGGSGNIQKIEALTRA